jgi:hypothetical protein
MRIVFPLTTGFVLALLLAACGATAEPTPLDCGSQPIVVAPTATRERDPDLFSPPSSAGGGDGRVYCATPVPPTGPQAEPPDGFVATEVVNLSLDIGGQDLAAAAVGRETLAVAWLSEGDIFVALARGGDQLQVRRVDSGESVSLAFSRANRLHMAYAQNGQILYRAADEGRHPAEADPFVVESVLHPISDGRWPQVVVDEMNWAHILYEQAGVIYKAKHLSNQMWDTQIVAYGAEPAVIPFYNEKELTLWGVPTGVNWFGLIMAAAHEEQIRLFRYLSWFNVWEQIASFPLPPGETLTGRIGLDFRAVSEEEAWVYAAWTTVRPSSQGYVPAYRQPVYDAANPFFPDQIGNPHHIYQGLNAARWQSGGAPFASGLRQTVAVDNPHEAVIATGWGLMEAGDGATTRLRLGIDPAGGLNPEAATVVWSETQAPTGFAPFQVSAAPLGGQATIFLDAVFDGGEQPGRAVWDEIALFNGTIENGNFEGGFSGSPGLVVPTGWTAYYADSGAQPVVGRDIYTVYAAWSDDGGGAWTGAEAVAANRDETGATTGAIGPDAQPLISLATEPPSVTFFYVYESGDPPPGSERRRFGRPRQSQCRLGTADCQTPGMALLPPGATTPSRRLLVAPDPVQIGRAAMVWEGLQTDYEGHDVYATYLALR